MTAQEIYEASLEAMQDPIGITTKLDFSMIITQGEGEDAETGSISYESTGKTMLSMITQSVGAIINIILDPLFIFGFDWSIAGSAYATVIAQTTALVYELVHFANPKNFLHFRRSIFRVRRAL